MPVAASARDCNEIKAEIGAKITAKGVADYILEVVDTPNVKEGKKIVGTCGGGAKQIVYRRGTPVEPNKRALEEKPAGT